MKGLLIVNLGSPEAPEPAALRRYLKQFLSDRRVVDKPRWLWWPILHLIILNIRPAKSARAYARIWTEQGSPLLYYTRKQAEGLQRLLGEDYQVAYAMRYGQPSIAQGLEQLKFCSSLHILPLYPQYSATTTASVYDAVFAELKSWRLLPEIHVHSHYYDRPAYIAALKQSILDFQQEHGQPEQLLMSFHGIPQAYAEAGDPYPQQCQQTAEKLAQALGLSEQQWRLCFQSRMGREPWLQPYTDHCLSEMARSGIKKVQVICPGFAADCLETLEEIAMENRQIFLQAGGEEYQYIPCLNDRQDHLQALADLIQ